MEITLSAQGSVDEYGAEEQAELIQRMTDLLGVPAADISVAVVAASVAITFAIQVASTAEAQSVAAYAAQEMASASMASKVLGVTTLSEPAISIEGGGGKSSLGSPSLPLLSPATPLTPAPTAPPPSAEESPPPSPMSIEIEDSEDNLQAVETAGEGASRGTDGRCARGQTDEHEAWSLHLDAPASEEQRRLVEQTIHEHALLECDEDAEVEWIGTEAAAVLIFGWPTMDTDADALRRWQATYRSEALFAHLHHVRGRLEDGEVRVTIARFEWHRPFYHAWKISYLAPLSFPFELFACWIAAPLTALIAVATTHATKHEPHFAGISDVVGSLPVAVILVICGISQVRKQRRVSSLVKVCIVSLIESLHFWHMALLVYEIHTSHHPDIDTAWGAISLLLLVMPAVLTLVAILGLVAASLTSQSGSLVSSEAIVAHPRGVTVVILLSALHVELISMLPWSAARWAGYPTRRVLACVVAMLLLQKLSVLVLSAHYIQVEPSAFGVYVLVFSVICLVQILMEKILLVLVAGGARLEDRLGTPAVPVQLTPRQPPPAQVASLRRSGDETDVAAVAQGARDVETEPSEVDPGPDANNAVASPTAISMEEELSSHHSCEPGAPEASGSGACVGDGETGSEAIVAVGPSSPASGSESLRITERLRRARAARTPETRMTAPRPAALSPGAAEEHTPEEAAGSAGENHGEERV